MSKKPLKDTPQDAETQALAVARPAEVDATALLAQLAQVVIVDAEALDMAGALLQDVKTRLKTLDGHRTSITKPILAAKNNVDKLFKPGIKALQDCEELLKGKIQAYMRQQEALVMQQLRAAATPAENGEALAPVTMTPLAQLPAGMVERKVWTFEVLNTELVPREYMCVDADKVSALIKALGGENVVIPGIRVYQEKQLAVRTV